MTLSAVVIDSSANTKIFVGTSAPDAGGNVLSYHYIVSAGTIIGSGATVEWDLTGVPAGTYTITVGVDDGAGVRGKTVTKTVDVK